MSSAVVQRALAVGALALATVVVALTLLGGGGPYVVHARFVDAGQMVKGGRVEIAGREIGTVKAITLTEDNHADIRMEITKEGIEPLRRGTRATIRAVGLSGVANRFVDLRPGPATGEPIPDGGVLTTAETTPIIDLDILLNALDAEVREDLQGVIRNGAEIFEDRTAEANEVFRYLNPAIFQGGAVAAELARDRRALERLLKTGAQMSSALASRAPDLEEGITASATTLEALARERTALQSVLGRAPVVLRQAQGTLGRVRGTLEELRPALREARPVAPRLARLLRQLVPTSRRARPVLADLRSILPNLTTALNLVPALEDVAVPAVKSTATTVARAMPIFAGLRPYGPDVVHGLTNSFGGSTTASYDANGHYGRVAPLFGQLSLQGTLGTLLPPSQVAGQRTGLVARCPGAAAEPANDRSNPYVPDPSLCDTAHNHPGRRR